VVLELLFSGINFWFYATSEEYISGFCALLLGPSGRCGDTYRFAEGAHLFFPSFKFRAPLLIHSANRFVTKVFCPAVGPAMCLLPNPSPNSQLQNSGPAPSIWLVFEKMYCRASRNGLLGVTHKSWGLTV